MQIAEAKSGRVLTFSRMSAAFAAHTNGLPERYPRQRFCFMRQSRRAVFRQDRNATIDGDPTPVYWPVNESNPVWRFILKQVMLSLR